MLSKAVFLTVPAIFVAAMPADTDQSAAQWFQTSRSTSDRLQRKVPIKFAPSDGSVSQFDVDVDVSKVKQKLLGFGGALTQSSASVYRDLPVNLKEQVIEAYYGPTGIGFTTGRLPIHSCDFSEESYTFDDTAGDVSLDDFDTEVTYDQTLSLPLILDALAVKPDLLLYGSPWSPPAWMKDNNDMCHGGSLLDQYQSTWANYISKWITAYENQAVPIW